VTPLEEELGKELLSIYDECRPHYPTQFRRMLTSSNPQFYRGPIGTVHYLLTRPAAGPLSTFERLLKAGMLTCTVEWLIANNPKWHPLFKRWPWLVAEAEARIRGAQQFNHTRSA